MNLPMILLRKGTYDPVALYEGSAGQGPRHFPALRRPWYGVGTAVCSWSRHCIFARRQFLCRRS